MRLFIIAIFAASAALVLAAQDQQPPDAPPRQSGEISLTINGAPGHELKYEDLTRDPVGQMRALYEKLNLGGFEAVRPKLDEYLSRTRGYETNKYQIAPEQKAEITRRWGEQIRRWGYDDKEPGHST